MGVGLDVELVVVSEVVDIFENLGRSGLDLGANSIDNIWKKIKSGQQVALSSRLKIRGDH